MLCRAVADASPMPMPMPMAGWGGRSHTFRYVNLAFCLLTGKSKHELTGTAFCGVTPGTGECMLLLDWVVKTALAVSHRARDYCYTSSLLVTWGVVFARGGHSHLGIMVQVTEAAKFHNDAVAMNQALLLGSVRQHELTAASDRLNVQLQAAIILEKC